MARQIYDAKIKVNFDGVNADNEPIASGDLLEVIIAKLIAKVLAINREYDELIKIPDYSGEKAGKVLRYIGDTSPYIAWSDESHISLLATGYNDSPTVLEHGGKIYPITNMSYDKENRQIKFVVTPMRLPEWGHIDVDVKGGNTATSTPRQLSFGDVITPVTGISTDEYGHVTAFTVTLLKLPELPENIGNTAEALTKSEIDGACDYLPTDDSGIKPLTDEQIDTICVG